MVKKFLRKLVLSDQEIEKLDSNQGPQKIIVHTKPIGSSGTTNYSGYDYEEYLDGMRGVERAKTFDKMRRSDTQVKMNLSAVKNPIKSAHWHIRNPIPDDENMFYMTEFVEFVLFEDTETPWPKLLREGLSCIDFGHSVFEITHKAVLNHPKFGSYNGIKAIDWRSPKTIERWNLDKETGKLASISQYAYGDLDRLVDIDAEFLMIFNIDMEGSNYEGISMLRPCYGPWFRKNDYLKLNAIGIEKFAVPTPLVKVREGFSGTEDYDNLVEALEEYVVHENNYLIYPDGVEINLNSNTYDPSKIESSIVSEEVRMTKAFLANFLELGMGGGGGAYALSNDLSDFFTSGIEYIAQEICDKINRHIIKPLIKMNFGEQEKYPELRFDNISDKAGKELAEMLEKLINTQAIIPDEELEEHLRKKMNLPKMSMEGQRIKAQPSIPVGPDNNVEMSERSEFVKNIIKAAYGR